MPYIRKRLDQTASAAKIVPLVVGNLGSRAEKELGRALAPWVRDSENAFVVSSDFCHWGLDTFDYAPYSATGSVDDLETLQPGQKLEPGASVEDTIEAMDQHALEAVKLGNHDAFLASLKKTKNTVCGRHPIGVILAALEAAAEGAMEEDTDRFKFKVTKYTTSGKVKGDRPIRDCFGHSVSYVSAYAIV